MPPAPMAGEPNVTQPASVVIRSVRVVRLVADRDGNRNRCGCRRQGQQRSQTEAKNQNLLHTIFVSGNSDALTRRRPRCARKIRRRFAEFIRDRAAITLETAEPNDRSRGSKPGAHAGGPNDRAPRHASPRPRPKRDHARSKVDPQPQPLRRVRVGAAAPQRLHSRIRWQAAPRLTLEASIFS